MKFIISKLGRGDKPSFCAGLPPLFAVDACHPPSGGGGGGGEFSFSCVVSFPINTPPSLVLPPPPPRPGGGAAGATPPSPAPSAHPTPPPPPDPHPLLSSILLSLVFRLSDWAPSLVSSPGGVGRLGGGGRMGWARGRGGGGGVVGVGFSLVGGGNRGGARGWDKQLCVGLKMDQRT